MKALKVVTIVLFALLIISGCKNTADLDANGIPGKLIIAHFNSGDAPAVKKGIEPVREYLEKKLGIPVEYIITSDYTAVIEALRAKKAHIAYLSPFSYILAAQNHDIIPMVTAGENGKPTMYHSVIFTNPQTGLNSMDDVKARAKKLSLCFADPASTSGHLIPRAYLTTIGLNPDNRAFKETIFGGSHLATVMTVASGKADIGCSTTEYGLGLAERKGLIKKEQVKILWVSDPIVASPIVARNDLNKNFIKKIQDAYLDMPKDAPEAFKIYMKLTHDHTENLAYITVQDSLYNGLRKIAHGIKDLSIIK